ncbi:unnamed protein product [Cercospora beticola]|nr:unnamed protein product [Cercospora beticola]
MRRAWRACASQDALSMEMGMATGRSFVASLLEQDPTELKSCTYPDTSTSSREESEVLKISSCKSSNQAGEHSLVYAAAANHSRLYCKPSPILEQIHAVCTLSPASV